MSPAEAAHGPRPRGQDVPGVGGPSGRPRRLRGLAPGPSLLAANLNCPGFFISKAGINRPPRAAVETGALLSRHLLCYSKRSHGVTAALGAADGLGAAAQSAVLTLRLSHKPNTLVKHFTRLSPAPQEEAARAHPAGSALRPGSQLFPGEHRPWLRPGPGGLPPCGRGLGAVAAVPSHALSPGSTGTLPQDTRRQEANGATSRGTEGAQGAEAQRRREELRGAERAPLLPAPSTDWEGRPAGWKPMNLGFLHEFCLLCPPPWASLKDVTSEVSLSVKHRQLYLPRWALNGISGKNIKDPGLPVQSLSHV